MEQPLDSKKSLFSKRAQKEALSFFKLAVPMFLTQLALQLIQVNSVIQSGNYSTDVQAGIMLAGNLWFPIMVGIGGVLFFVTPMVAQLYGARNLKEIGPLARQAIWLSIPIVLFGMFVLSQASWILTLAKVDPDIIFYSEEYLSYFIFALPAILLSQPLRSLCEGVTKPLPITLLNILMLLIAIVANYTFIYGNFGFPEMGARGAGLSAIIGTWTSFIILIVYLRFKSAYGTEFFSKFEFPDFKILHEILRGGIPVGLGNFIELSMFSGAGIILGRFGSEVIAANGIALTIGGLFFMVPLSIGNAAAVRVGNNVGAKNLKGAKYSSYFSLRLATVCALIMSLTIILNAEFLSGMLNSNPKVISLAVILLGFAAFFQVADGLAMASIGSLRGYKDTFGPMKILAVSYWGVGLPVGIMLSITNIITEQMGAVGMWAGMAFGLLVAAVLMVRRVRLISSRFINEN
ncbi:MAG: MATE family efflux transporter [Gammaproteobacteria bacterium]|nr:MAG: MATE family efflux transporter [Gammaproteobacteria bacterium]